MFSARLVFQHRSHRNASARTFLRSADMAVFRKLCDTNNMAGRAIAIEPQADPTPETLEQAREERIRARAHALYLERVKAGETGSALADWLRAEAEITES